MKTEQKSQIDTENSASVKIDGNKLVITILINEHASSSGKTTVVATTAGNKVLAMYKGKPLYVGVNAYVPNK